MIPVTDTAAALAAAAGALGSLTYITGKVHAVGRRIDALNRLAGKELAHNHGTSIKDDVHGIALSVNELHQNMDRTQAEMQRLRYDLDHHINSGRPRRRFRR